jgi:prephenate dehydratase
MTKMHNARAGAFAGDLIVYQGEPGANSHLAALEAFPKLTAQACATFEEAFQAVSERKARLAMIPIENSVFGRVADIHHLLPESGLYIVGEHFLRIHHQLMAVKGATLSDIKRVHSHAMALGQCRKIIRELNLSAVVEADTAGAARIIAESGDKGDAAIAPRLAAQTYGLEILKENIEDAAHNTTRFLVLAKDPDDADPQAEHVITSFIFRVRNVPAALYKALGGFATNNVNITKLESYQLDGSFLATQFYADIEGHPLSRNVRLAIEELGFFTSQLKILGIYEASPFRYRNSAEQTP